MVLYLNEFVRMHTNDVQKDQKKHKADTIDSTMHEKSSDTKKLIPRVQNRTTNVDCKNKYHSRKISP